MFISIILSVLLQANVGYGQPSIVDVSFPSNNIITLRWEVQCNYSEEVTDIIYGCTQNSSIQDNDLTTIRYRVNKVEKYREIELKIRTMNTNEIWRCVFKLMGVKNIGCSTEDSLCVFVDVTSFSRFTGLFTLIHWHTKFQ